MSINPSYNSMLSELDKLSIALEAANDPVTTEYENYERNKNKVTPKKVVKQPTKSSDVKDNKSANQSTQDNVSKAKTPQAAVAEAEKKSNNDNTSSPENKEEAAATAEKNTSVLESLGKIIDAIIQSIKSAIGRLLGTRQGKLDRVVAFINNYQNMKQGKTPQQMVTVSAFDYNESQLKSYSSNIVKMSNIVFNDIKKISSNQKLTIVNIQDYEKNLVRNVSTTADSFPALLEEIKGKYYGEKKDKTWQSGNISALEQIALRNPTQVATEVSGNNEKLQTNLTVIEELSKKTSDVNNFSNNSIDLVREYISLAQRAYVFIAQYYELLENGTFEHQLFAQSILKRFYP